MSLSLNEALANAKSVLSQEDTDAEHIALLDLIKAVETAPEPSKTPEPFGSPQDAGLVAGFLDDMPDAWLDHVSENTDLDDADETGDLATGIVAALHTYAETDG